MAPLLDPAAAGFARYRLVALAGVDGGGKTFLLQALQRRLDEAGVPHRHVWSRFRNYLSKPLLALARLTGHNRKEEMAGVRTGYHDFVGRPWLAWPFLCLQVVDSVLDSWWRYHRGHDRRVILADRCIYDTLVDLAVDTGLDEVVFGRLGRWLVGRLPAPHLAVVLNRPVAAIRADRPDVLLDRNFARRRALYRRLADEFRLPVLENDGTAEAVLDRLERLATSAVIYVFYHNDPLAQDLGGGAEHFRCLHRALAASDLPFRLVASRLQDERSAAEVVYIARRPGFLRFYLALWAWFWRCRGGFADEDVFHFHRNYAAWPKLLLAPRRGRVIVSYHNVTGRVLEGWLGRLAAPVRRVMLAFERRVARPGRRHRLRQRARPQRAGAARGAGAVHPRACRARRVRRRAVRARSTRRRRHRSWPIASWSWAGSATRRTCLWPWRPWRRLAAAGDDFQLTIAGRGEGSKDLIRLIACSPAAGRIRWIGAVPHDEVPALLREHGMLLLTSRYEASPTVVKEALRVMRPVVSTDVGDVADWLEADRTGFVCAATAEALADGVRAASRLIREGRYRVTSRLEQLDEGRLMSEVLTLYRQLASR